MPALVPSLGIAVASALDLARKSEAARVALLNGPDPVRLTERDINLLYEVSYLRIFVAWEDFLDNAFAYYLCGRPNSTGRERLAAGCVYAKTLREARSRAYDGQLYSLWHNPHRVIFKARRHFDSGLIESVVASDLTNLEYYAWTRHRIAHGHDDSKAKFDRVTMSLAAKRYRAGRPGRFLRDAISSSNPPLRWIEKIGADLVSLAAQIVP